MNHKFHTLNYIALTFTIMGFDYWILNTQKHRDHLHLCCKRPLCERDVLSDKQDKLSCYEFLAVFDVDIAGLHFIDTAA